MNREPIFQRLFELGSTISWQDADEVQQSFITTERKLRLFADVPTDQQPYMAQQERDEVYAQRTNLPYRVELTAAWVIYHSNGDTDAALTIVNNNILDACHDALKPAWNDPGFVEDRNTLLGLVHHCYIGGTIFKDPGDIDRQAMLMVPIKILVP